MNSSTACNLFHNVRIQAKISENTCSERISHHDPNEFYDCFDSYCLFNIHRDPCEFQNIATHNRQILNMTIDMLEQFKTEIVKQQQSTIDPNADPRHFNGYWDTWMDSRDVNNIKDL